MESTWRLPISAPGWLPAEPGRPEDGAADVEALRGADVIVRIEPGDIRVRDYADEFGTS